MAAYNSYSKPGMSNLKVPNSNHEHHHGNHPSPSDPRSDPNSIAKLVREELRRQTQYLTQANRPSNSGVPSTRNRRTTDGLPFATNVIKLVILLVTVELRECNMFLSIIHISVPACNASINFHLNIIPIYIRACNISLHRGPSII